MKIIFKSVFKIKLYSPAQYQSQLKIVCAILILYLVLIGYLTR
jgi:hypothetical protein